MSYKGRNMVDTWTPQPDNVHEIGNMLIVRVEPKQKLVIIQSLNVTVLKISLPYSRMS